MSSQRKWLTASAAPVEILEICHFGFLSLMVDGSLSQVYNTLAGLNFPKLDGTEITHHNIMQEHENHAILSKQ